MDLRYTEDEEAFRGELRAWLDEVVPALPRRSPSDDDWDARREYDTGWQRMLFDAGYAGINWPKEFGGRGATPTEHLIYIEETERARAPVRGRATSSASSTPGPTLIVEGSPEQKAYHLPGHPQGRAGLVPGLLRAERGLRPRQPAHPRRARRRRVRGQRPEDLDQLRPRRRVLRDARAHEPDPEVRKQAGITWLIVPMDAAGIDIRPLRAMEGTTEFCEVFLDDVRVPVANRVGDENDGWRVANVTLSFERGTAFVADVMETEELLRDLVELAKHLTSNGATRWEDAGLRRDLGHITAELDALWALTKRNISQAQRTGLVGVGGSVFKLAFTELRHRLGDIAMHLLDRASLSIDDVGDLPSGRHVQARFWALRMSIAAGTSQVQRNIVGERVLGLPRER